MPSGTRRRIDKIIKAQKRATSIACAKFDRPRPGGNWRFHAYCGGSSTTETHYEHRGRGPQRDACRRTNEGRRCAHRLRCQRRHRSKTRQSVQRHASRHDSGHVFDAPQDKYKMVADGSNRRLRRRRRRRNDTTNDNRGARPRHNDATPARTSLYPRHTTCDEDNNDTNNSGAVTIGGDQCRHSPTSLRKLSYSVSPARAGALPRGESPTLTR